MVKKRKIQPIKIDFFHPSKNATLMNSNKRDPLLFAKPNKKYKPVSYLGLKQSRPMNFLGLKGPYGDKDFDGSPNKWDCSPNQVSKDGIMSRLLNIATLGRAGQSKADYKTEKKEKYEAYIYPKANVQDPRQFKVIKERYKNPSPKQKRYNRFMDVVSKLDPKGYQEKMAKVERLLAQRSAAGTASQLRKKEIKAYLKTLPPRTSPEDIKLKEIAYRRKLKAEAEAASGSGQGSGSTKEQEQIRRLQERMLLDKVRAMTKGTRTTRSSGKYAKQLRTVSQFIPSGYGNRGGPRAVVRVGGKKGSKGGRPAGTYTHVIPGVGPVHVYEWRKWVGAQKRARRMAEQDQQYAPQPDVPMRGDEDIVQPQQPPQPIQQYGDESRAKYESELPPDNKFTRYKQFEQSGYSRQHFNRLLNEQPKGFVQDIVRMKQEANERAREFSRRTNILRAHEHMLTPQQNAINFLDTSNNLLDSRGNNILETRPDSIRIALGNTGRPTILQAPIGNDVSNMNPLKSERLNFGKVNVTDTNSVL